MDLFATLVVDIFNTCDKAIFLSLCRYYRHHLPFMLLWYTSLVNNEAKRDKQKMKNMQNIVTIFKQQLKYFRIESYSQNWQIADSHEKVQAGKKKNIIFIILLFPIYLHVQTSSCWGLLCWPQISLILFSFILLSKCRILWIYIVSNYIYIQSKFCYE